MQVVALLFAAISLNTFAQSNVVVSGYITNEVNREAVNGAQVIIRSADGKTIAKSTTYTREGISGYYQAVVKAGQQYVVRIEKPSYFQTEYSFSTPLTEKYAEISRDYVIKPLEVNTKIPLLANVFDYKKSSLRVGYEEIINDVVKALTINPGVQIEIQAFPDIADNKETNEKLTTERCKAVVSFLTANGIPASRISMKPSAEIDPENPIPVRKVAKGERYIGKVYIVVKKA